MPHVSGPLSCSERALWDIPVVRQKLPEAKKMIEGWRIVPMTRRPTKTHKLDGTSSRTTMTVEEKKEHCERTDQGRVKLGLFILTFHLQKFVENRSLQAVLKEHDLLVSWDNERKKVVVVTSPRRLARSKKGRESRPRTASGDARLPSP